MVIAVKVTVNDRDAMDLINNRVAKLPEDINKSGFAFNKKLEKNLRFEVVKRNLIYDGRLYNSIKAKQLSKNTSTLSMAYYGGALDRAYPHWVELKRGRKITEWAKSRGFRGIKALQVFTPKWSWRYKGWFTTTFNNTLMQLRPELKRVVTRRLGG